MAGAVAALKKALPGAGGRLLVNESHQLESGLWVAGVDDPASWRDDVYVAAGDIPTKAPRILLAHSPDIVHSQDFWAHPELRFGLILAGHTHGGQVRFPLIGALYTLRMDPRILIAAGFQRIEEALLHITTGLGHTIPLRFGVPPEVVWLECEPSVAEPALSRAA